MAFDVSYIFKARDKFSKISKKVNKNMVMNERQAKKLALSFNKIGLAGGRAFKKIASLKGLIAGAGFLLAFKKIVNVGADFQESLAEVSAITGATGNNLDRLSDKSKELGLKFGIASATILQGFKLVGSAKPELLKNIPALESMTEQVLLLQAASGLDLETASLVAARGLNIFGKGADQASKFVNILAAGAQQGSSEIADTGAALLLAGGSADAAGLSFVQLNALIQTVAKAGFVGARSGTALNAMLGRLQRLGLDFKKIGLQESFQLIADKMATFKTSTERANFAQKVFGEEHSKVGFGILKNITLLSRFEKTLKGTNAAQEQANIRLATFNTRIKRIGVQIQLKLIDTFDRLEPKLIDLAQRFTKFLDSIGENQIDNFVAGLKSILSITEKLVGVMTTLSNLFSNKIFAGALAGAAGGALVGGPVGAVLGGVGGAAFGASSIAKEENNPAALFGGGSPFTGNILGGKEKSESEINVNINAPPGIVQSIASKGTGLVRFNLGQNGVTP